MNISKNNKIIVVIVTIIVVILGLKVLSVKQGKVENTLNSPTGVSKTSVSNSETSNGEIKSIDVPTPTKAYASTDDGFLVNFPTLPKVDNTTYRLSSAGTIPLTEYSQEYSSGLQRAWYKVAVYHFPANYKFADNFLDESADAYIGSVNALHPGSKVANHEKTQFLGNPAITGTVTVPVKLDSKSTATTDTNNYATMTAKGKNLYIISTYGMTKDKFDLFLSSFKFQ